MKATNWTQRFSVLGGGLIMSLALAALWLSGSDDHTAHAQGGTADLKIQSQQVLASDCVSPLPANINVSEDVDICVVKDLHNNGPDSPVQAFLNKTATAPDGCTITPAVVLEPVELQASVEEIHEEHFTIHCGEPSAHGPFTITNSIAAVDPLIADPNLGNNSATNSFSVNAIGHSDVKEVAYVMTSAPPVHPVIGNPYIQHSSTTGIATGTITMQKTVANAGPWGPATVHIAAGNAIIAYAGMSVANADCTVNPAGAVYDQQSLPLGVTTLPAETYTLTCGRGGIEKDDDGDALADEDRVDSTNTDDDGDTLINEDSPFYLVTIAFQDGMTAPKEPHVVDDNPTNNQPLAEGSQNPLWCYNGVDDDADGSVDDGCPQQGAATEAAIMNGCLKRQ